MKWSKAFLAPLVLLAGLLLAFAAPSRAAPQATEFTSHGPICIEAEVFIARAAVLDQTHVNAYTDYICTLVSSGVWAASDAIYLLATQSSAVALLNLKSTNYALTTGGTIPFTKDRGFTGDGSTGFLNTGFNPSTAGGNFAQNDHYIGIGVLSRGAGLDIGNTNGTTSWLYISFNSASASTAGANDLLAGRLTNVMTRTGSTASTLYLNGVTFVTSATASVALLSLNIYIGCANASGSAGYCTTSQEAYAAFGKALTAAQAYIYYQAGEKYLHAIGAR